MLALKLAVESYFGIDVMSQSTPMGCSKYKRLPVIELNRLKQFRVVLMILYHYGVSALIQ